MEIVHVYYISGILIISLSFFLYRRASEEWISVKLKLTKTYGTQEEVLALVRTVQHQNTVNSILCKGLAKVVGVGFFQTNARGEWTEVDSELCKILALSEADLLGKTWMQYTNSYVHTEWNHSFEEKIPFVRDIVFMINNVPTRVRIVTMLHENGTVGIIAKLP